MRNDKLYNTMLCINLNDEKAKIFSRRKCVFGKGNIMMMEMDTWTTKRNCVLILLS